MQYVGQTLCDDINTRWKQHKDPKSNSVGRYLLSAYKKYGIENFSYKIICVCFDEDCNRFEEDYIKKFGTLAPNGYNLKSGGNNSKQHPDTIQLIKERLKGRRCGPIATAETLKKKSDAMKGEKNPNYGTKISEERKKHLSAGMKASWKKRTENNTIINVIHNNSLANLTTRKEENKKKVGQYDINNTLIAVFDSVSEASSKTNISRGSISKVCNGVKRYKTAGGFVWKFM